MLETLKESWIIPAIILVAVAGASLGVYLPQGRKLDNLRSEIAAQKVAIQNDSIKAAVVPQLRIEVEALKAKLKNFDRKLPKQHELGNFLKTISGCLAKHKLLNQSIEPGNPIRDSEMNFHTLPIIMRVQGDYLSLAGFLEEIDTMERTTRIQRMKIHRPKIDTPLEIELQMNIYFDSSTAQEES